jgi:uncharacterized protein (DUF2141 family)
MAAPILCLVILWPVFAQAAGQTAVPCSGAASGPRIHIEVSGARRVAGNVTFTLYGEDRSRFLARRGSIALTRVTLTGPVAEGCFAVSAPGTYAVAVYHDENDNHHFDRTLLGLPAEGYGFSNNAAIFLGPPSFDSVRFTVGPGDTRLSIALRY